MAYLVAPSLSTKEAASFGEWVVFSVWAAFFWWRFCLSETVSEKVWHLAVTLPTCESVCVCACELRLHACLQQAL